MKKYLILFIAVLASSFFVGCDNDDLETANYVTFEAETLGFGVERDASGSLEVTVYTSHKTGSDRTFSIQVDTTTLVAESYTLPTSVTIPANTNAGTFTLEVTDTEVDNAGETMILSIVDNKQDLFVGEPLKINIARVCPFEIAGTFTDQSGWYEGAIPGIEVVAGADPGVYVVKAFFGGKDLIFTVNPDFSITVLKQETGTHPTYGQMYVEGGVSDAGESSKVSPCDGEIILVLEHTVSAGSFGAYVETLSVAATQPL